MSEGIEVIQADRNAAESVLWELYPDADWNGPHEEREQRILIERIGIGEEDSNFLVEAFAKHRIAHKGLGED